MSFEEFHNALRIIRSLDIWEVGGAGVEMSAEEWTQFRNNPYEAFIGMPRSDAECIWTLIYRRQPAKIKAQTWIDTGGEDE